MYRAKTLFFTHSHTLYREAIRAGDTAKAVEVLRFARIPLKQGTLEYKIWTDKAKKSLACGDEPVEGEWLHDWARVLIQFSEAGQDKLLDLVHSDCLKQKAKVSRVKQITGLYHEASTKGDDAKAAQLIDSLLGEGTQECTKRSSEAQRHGMLPKEVAGQESYRSGIDEQCAKIQGSINGTEADIPNSAVRDVDNSR